MWALSLADPVDVLDWDGTWLHGLPGYLTVHALWPVFWLFTALGAAGVVLLMLSIRAKKKWIKVVDDIGNVQRQR